MVSKSYTDTRAERAQSIRDLRKEIAELAAEDDGEIIFQDTSPTRRRAIVYSMTTGEKINILAHRLERVLSMTLPDGRFAFTARQGDAPPFRKGNVKCFLHPESPRRPVLEEIGLSGIVCLSGNLASEYAERMHSLHKHKQERAALQEHLTKLEREQERERQDRQLEATLDIARGTSRPAPTSGPATSRGDSYTCACGKETKSNAGLQAHIRGAHPA